MGRVQVLVAAMNQIDHSLLSKMNIQSDAIVANQCSFNSIERFKWSSCQYEILYLNFNERGVGLNRNNALMRATGEFCIFADDDVTYVNNYTDIIEHCFDKYTTADVIVFNVKEENTSRYVIKKVHRVRLYNCMRYGAVRIAIRKDRIKKNGVFFNLCFGGGTEYSAGEDVLFLVECIKKGLKVVAVPITIVELKNSRESTWFHGYNEKFFRDHGMLFETVSKRYRKILCLQDAIRHSKKYGIPWYKAYTLMLDQK